ncbi:hypothetical protein ABT294_42490 [Nonomuraea sp. NPDC000554]|uniref:hypothetical protein n=1 Tax=Nonomuraea sp. NPDC000554 TaxID=3154259 RepID=UPI003324EB39
MGQDEIVKRRISEVVGSSASGAWLVTGTLAFSGADVFDVLEEQTSARRLHL